jgi:hypothetical protein
VFRAAHGELEADALVPPQQREEPVGRRRAHHLDPPAILEVAQRGDDVPT